MKHPFRFRSLSRAMRRAVPIACATLAAVVSATSAAAPDSPRADDQIETGRYLAIAANCAGCHTARPNAPYAGGTALPTGFGTFYGPNITPSKEHGIGTWSADDFWQAMHLGKAPDGSPLYPAFPYPQYTAMSRADSDALYAYLMSLPAIDTPSRPHELRFPYDQRWLLSAWRALYFKPGQATPVTTDDADVQRGHYLVEVAGHCTACHTPRNRWGATDLARSLQGAVMPDSKWYATPLSGDAAGLADWSEDDIVQVLRTGFSRHGTAAGPMGEVVSHSTQYLHDTDLRAMARYLKTLPAATPAKPPRAAPDDAAMVTGARLYEQHCASCHGAEGEGAPPHWPALAGNASVKAPLANNVVLSILKGGYSPTTAHTPQPHGMPPFHALSDSDVAALATFVRNSWGNAAGPVNPHQVTPLR